MNDCKLQESDIGADDENGNDSDYGRRSKKSRGVPSQQKPATPVQQDSSGGEDFMSKEEEVVLYSIGV